MPTVGVGETDVVYLDLYLHAMPSTCWQSFISVYSWKLGHYQRALVLSCSFEEKKSRNLGLTQHLLKLANYVAYSAWWWCLKDCTASLVTILLIRWCQLKKILRHLFCNNSYPIACQSQSLNQSRDVILQRNQVLHFHIDIIQSHSLLDTSFFEFFLPRTCSFQCLLYFWKALIGIIEQHTQGACRCLFQQLTAVD